MNNVQNNQIVEQLKESLKVNLIIFFCFWFISFLRYAYYVIFNIQSKINE